MELRLRVVEALPHPDSMNRPLSTVKRWVDLGSSREFSKERHCLHFSQPEFDPWDPS